MDASRVNARADGGDGAAAAAAPASDGPGASRIVPAASSKRASATAIETAAAADGYGGATPTPLRMLADPIAYQVMPSRRGPVQQPGAQQTARRSRSAEARSKAERDAQLMPPPPARGGKRKRMQETVMDEDAYVDALGAVIQRDFFPDLPKLQAQLDVLEALESGDVARVTEANAALQATLGRVDPFLATSQTPAAVTGEEVGGSRAVHAAGGVTPLVHVQRAGDDDAASVVSWSDGVRDAKRQRISLPARAPGPPAAGPFNRSDASAPAAADPAHASDARGLDAFLTQHTSEDNASFATNFDAHTATRRRAHWWLYEPVDSAKLKLMLEDGHAGRAAPSAKLLQDVNVAGVQRILDADRPASVRSWPHRPRNAMFFLPDLEASNAVSSVTAPQPNADLPNVPAGQQLLLAGGDAPRLLTDAARRAQGGGGAAPTSTALAVPTITAYGGMDLILPSGHRLKPDGGIVAPREIHHAATRLRGSQLKALVTGEQATAVVEAVAAKAAADAAPGSQGGYAYVATPQLEPGIDMTPLMTWGDVAGTPLILDAASTATPSTVASVAGLLAGAATPLAAPGSAASLAVATLSAALGIEPSAAAAASGSAPSQFRLQPGTAREQVAEALAGKAAEARRRRTILAAGGSNADAALAAVGDPRAGSLPDATPASAGKTRRALAAAAVAAKDGILGPASIRAARTPVFAATPTPALAAGVTPAASAVSRAAKASSASVVSRAGSAASATVSALAMKPAARMVAQRIAAQSAAAREAATAGTASPGGLALGGGDAALAASYRGRAGAHRDSSSSRRSSISSSVTPLRNF